MTTASKWSVRQKIEIPFQYTAGPAVTRFLEGLKEGVILAGACGNCGRRSVPPLSFCGRCWLAVDQYVALSGRGTLSSYTTLADGRVVGLVQLEGADSVLAHWIEGRAAVGAAVEVVWQERREASILAIAAFRVSGT